MVIKEALPDTYEGKLVHLIEECSEVIKAATKIIRFGPFNYYKNPPNNADVLEAELKDLAITIRRVRKHIP